MLERTAERQCGGTLTNAADRPALHLTSSRAPSDTLRAAARPDAAADLHANAPGATHWPTPKTLFEKPGRWVGTR
mgnify:CR=1 FL=1